MTSQDDNNAPTATSGEEHPTKCPCCDNPWSRATGDLFAKMCLECKEEEDKNKKKATTEGFTTDNMDLSVKPYDNFYYYTNGLWMKNNPIPKEYPSWNTFLSLHVKSQENLKNLINELCKKQKEGETLSEEENKVALFYNMSMDEETIESNDTKPLEPLFDLCNKIVEEYNKKKKKKNGEDNSDDDNKFEYYLGQMDMLYGVNPFFSGLGASPDNKNSNNCIAQLAQGGLGLPDRDYYFDDDKDDKRIEYKKHIAKMLSFLDDNSNNDIDEKYVNMANSIYKLEYDIATKHMTKTENRDPEATYNKMSIEDLSSKVCNGTFNFVSYFAGCTHNKTPNDIGDVNIRNVEALKHVTSTIDESLQSTTTTNTDNGEDKDDSTKDVGSVLNSDVLLHYLRWHCIKSYAPYTSKKFVNENFNFYSKVLTGQEEIKPRWKRCMTFIESALGEVLGKIYCDKYFNESCKEKALSIVENVRLALEQRLKEVEWMTSDETRSAALQKMSKFRIKIGYPDKWIDYTPLVFDSQSDTFLSMVYKSRQFDHDITLSEINKPTNRDKWFMTPQTVNAYYHPSLNEIVFPAAILQPPFFDIDADDAINYGSMGSIVGHEMTHGFDDKGRKYNYEGNMIDWWTKADADEYEKRVDVMIEQASEFTVHGQNVQGKLTCGENIADLGGLRLALRALQLTPDFDNATKIDNFTPVQRFFLAWGTVWRQNITKERSLQLITLDPHGPNEMRCNGPLSNIEEFHNAFNIPEDSPMYKPKESRVDIW